MNGDRGVTVSGTDSTVRQPPERVGALGPTPVRLSVAVPVGSPRCAHRGSCASDPATGSCSSSPGAEATPPKSSPRENEGRANSAFPQDTTLVHGPAVPGSVGARGGSGEGSAGLTVAEGRSRGVRAAEGGEPRGALPGPGAHPGVCGSQRARGSGRRCLPLRDPRPPPAPSGFVSGAPEPRPSRRAQPGRGGGRGCAAGPGGGGD